MRAEFWIMKCKNNRLQTIVCQFTSSVHQVVQKSLLLLSMFDQLIVFDQNTGGGKIYRKRPTLAGAVLRYTLWRSTCVRVVWRPTQHLKYSDKQFSVEFCHFGVNVLKVIDSEMLKTRMGLWNFLHIINDIWNLYKRFNSPIVW